MGATAMSSTVSNARPTAVSTIKREGSPARWVSTLLRIRRRDSTADVMASAPPSLISTAAQSPRGRGALVASERRDQRQHLQRIVGRFAAPDIERRDVPQIVVHPIALCRKSHRHRGRPIKWWALGLSLGDGVAAPVGGWRRSPDDAQARPAADRRHMRQSPPAGMAGSFLTSRCTSSPSRSRT